MSDQGEQSADQEARDRDNRAIVAQVLRELHDQGVVDMNAPAREALPYLQQSIARAQERAETAEARIWWWVFAGSCAGESYFFVCLGGEF